MSEEIWLVCGSRDYSDIYFMNKVLNHLKRERGRPILVVHGNARGADKLSGKWAKANGISVAEVDADWRKHGKAAGPIRNKKMLDLYNPHVVIAFPGGTGTANMMEQADERGVEVIDVKDFINDGFDYHAAAGVF